MTNNPTEINCRLCKKTSLEKLYTVKNCTIVRCSGCNLVQIAGRPNTEELYELYDEKYFNRGKYVEDKAQEREQIRRLKLLQNCGIKDNAAVLDGGCATGGFIKVASGHYKIWGIDISEFAIKQAKLDNPECAERITAGLIENQSFPENHFDAIVFWDVVEHLDSPLEVIKSFVKFLKPGGYFILSTPNIGAPLSKIMGKRWAFMTPPEHICLFDYGTMELLLNQSGLKIKHWVSKGKWVNIGFFLYKLAKVFPGVIPVSLVNFIRQSWLGSRLLYAPTGDIQYVVSQLNNTKETI